LRDAVGIALFVLGAGVGGGLLDQLPDIVADNGEAPCPFKIRRLEAPSASACASYKLRPLAHSRAPRFEDNTGTK
jgi:hypothetical protein